MYEKSRNLLDCHIAGFSYYDGLDAIEELKMGTVVRLQAEPDNPYDSDAIAVYYEDFKLGYIPRVKNDVLSVLLAFGHDGIIEARINAVSLEASPVNPLRIVVRIKDSRK